MARSWPAGLGSPPASPERSHAARRRTSSRPDTRTPATVDRLATSSDFRVGTPGQTPAPTAGGSDSVEAVRFKLALRNIYTVDVAERTIERVERRPLQLESLATTALARLDPA